MIVPSMTDIELLVELSKDYASCVARVQRDLNIYRRAIIKSNNFPIYFKPIDFISPRKNKFLLFLEAKSKKEAATGPFITFVAHYLKPEGIYAIMIFPAGPYEKQIFIYPPHLFERYKERFLKKDVGTIDAMKEYFKFNPTNILQRTEGNYFRGSCNQGFVFGEQLGRNISIIKTFISKEMFKGDQSALNGILEGELFNVETLKKQHKKAKISELLIPM